MTKVNGTYKYNQRTTISKCIHSLCTAVMLNVLYVIVFGLINDAVEKDVRHMFSFSNLRIVYFEERTIISFVFILILILSILVLMFVIYMYLKRKKNYYKTKIVKDLKGFVLNTPNAIVHETSFNGEANSEASQVGSSSFSKFKSDKKVEDTVVINYEYFVESKYLYLRFPTKPNSRFFRNDDKSLCKEDFENYFQCDVEFSKPEHNKSKSYYEVQIIKIY